MPACRSAGGDVRAPGVKRRHSLIVLVQDELPTSSTASLICRLIASIAPFVGGNRIRNVSAGMTTADADIDLLVLGRSIFAMCRRAGNQPAQCTSPPHSRSRAAICPRRACRAASSLLVPALSSWWATVTGTHHHARTRQRYERLIGLRGMIEACVRRIGLLGLSLLAWQAAASMKRRPCPRSTPGNGHADGEWRI